MPAIGEIIRALREKTGLSQNGLAVAVGGVTQHYISKLESGNRYPNRRILSSIIDVLLQKIDSRENVGLVFTQLIAAVIQDAIPGAFCELEKRNENGRISDILVTLQSGFKFDIEIKKSLTKIHDPMTQEIISKVLEDLEFRDALTNICRNNGLIELIKGINKKARILKMVNIISKIREDQYALVESVLHNLPKQN